MEITYLGWSCFKITEGEKSVLVDPFEPKMVGLPWKEPEADIVCVTHHHRDHDYVEGVKSEPTVIDAPGEYEIGGVRVYGTLTYHDDKKGQQRGYNTIYRIEMGEFKVAHLGDLGHKLSQEQLESLGEVDVLIIPIGGKYTIDYEIAAEVVSQVQPAVVIPCHYRTEDGKGVEGVDTVDKFLEEMGDEVQSQDKLKLTSQAQLPEETEVILLKVS